MRDLLIAYAPFVGPVLPALILAAAGLLAPYVPPLKRMLDARKIAAESTTHANDTSQINNAILTAGLNAITAMSKGTLTKEAAIAAGAAYVREKVPEITAKIGITDDTLQAMVNSRIEAALLPAGVAAMLPGSVKL